MGYSEEARPEFEKAYVGTTSIGGSRMDVREPEIRKYMGAAFGNLDSLRNELSMVRDKIRPVCNENRTQVNSVCTKDSAPLATLCPLGDQLRELAESIRHIRDDIVELGNIIEL
jgi:hypothetical protein